MQIYLHYTFLIYAVITLFVITTHQHYYRLTLAEIVGYSTLCTESAALQSR